MAHLYIIRGLPGSGKSTLAHKMGEAGLVDLCLEADDYFYRGSKYMFNQTQLSVAHGYCLDNTKTALKNGARVSVSNTFSRKWEMQPYIEFCENNKIGFTVIKCEGDYGSIHAPRHVREGMAKRWED